MNEGDMKIMLNRINDATFELANEINRLEKLKTELHNFAAEIHMAIITMKEQGEEKDG